MHEGITMQHDDTQTHHSSGGVISPTQRQHSQPTEIHVPGEIRKRKGVCTHSGKTGAGSDSDSDAGCNVNKWAFSHAAGPAELPARQICVPDWNSTSRTPHNHLLCAAYQFQCTALQLAHVSEPVGVLNTSVCLCTNIFFVLLSISN